MTINHRLTWALMALAIALPAAAEPAGGPPPPQTIVLKVGVDATGHVTSMASPDPQAVPAMVQAAEGYARKLQFAPARKDGIAVASETNLSLVLAVEPAGEGKFALKLRRAVNGPGVVTVGKMDTPKYQGRKSGALIVVSVDVDAEGRPAMDSFKSEKVELRDPNSFAEARYLDAIRTSVRHSQFAPDKVAGAAVPSRISLPYRFGMGGAKPKPGEYAEERNKKPAPVDPTDLPSMTAVSTQPDIELPKIDYKAPKGG
jgi:hypothetical protein